MQYRLACKTNLVCLVIIILLIIGTSSPGFARDIVAGVPANFPPHYVIDQKTGKPAGFAIDVMDEIARALDLQVQYVVFDTWGEVLEAIQKGRIDIIPNLGIVENRKNYVDFTIPLESFHIVIFVRSSTNNIYDETYLAGHSVAVVTHNQGQLLMQNRNDIRMQEFNSIEKAFLSLISGNSDALVYPGPPLERIARQSGLQNRIKIAGNPLLEVKRGIAVAKERTSLLAAFDAQIKKFIETPQYRQIYSKWYGEPTSYWTVRRTVIVMFIILVSSIIVLLIWRYYSLITLNRKLTVTLSNLREAEKEIIRTKERYQSVFVNAQDAMYLINPETREIVECNRKAAEMDGYTQEELQHMSVYDLYPDDEKELLPDIFSDISKWGVATGISNLHHKKKDGTIVPIEINATLVSIADKKLNLSVVRDITERYNFEIELEGLLAKLSSKNEALERILYATSHDLRTPLVNIDGFSNELRNSLEELQSELEKSGPSDCTDENVKRILNNDIPESLMYITSSIEKMNILISGILEMSRLGRAELKKNKLDMNRLLGSIKTNLAFQIINSNASVELTDLPPCTADQSQIEHVFTNIMENALKFFTPGRSGNVRISGVSKGAESIYCVEDNGIGIAPAYQSKIFEIFHQLSPDQYSGKGLGLTIARSIVEKLNGRIWVESEQGKGSKFYVSLPYKQS